ncbi:30S ribosomal protein S4e [archaeon]|nr:30S ribosomal protein S4e [archaeon]
MKTHQKRNSAPKTWPIPRKGTTFVIKKNGNGVPILVVLRDMMKLAQTRKEVKLAIHEKNLVIGTKLVNDEKKSLELFDTLTIIPEKKSYRLVLNEKGKYAIDEITDKEAKFKVSKIIGKKSMKGKKTQLNLYDGRNYLSTVDCKVNDSVLIDLEKNEISKVLPLKEKANALIIGGKHAGSKGVITSMLEDKQMVELATKDQSFKVLIKQLMVTE